MKRHSPILLVLALSLALVVMWSFWRVSPWQDGVEQGVAATKPSINARTLAPSASPQADTDAAADPDAGSREGVNEKPEGRRRAERIVERMHEKSRLYAPPKVDRGTLLAYLRQRPDDVALHVWAAHALHDVTLLPDGGDPMILWARMWLPLSGTQQMRGEVPLTPEFRAMAERLAVLDPGNALPQLLLAAISAKGENMADALSFLEAASRLPLNDYSGPLHQAGMEYLAAQGWSPTQRLRAKIDYLGSYGVDQQLGKLLRAEAGRPGLSSGEKSLFHAARLQQAAIDYSETGVVGLNSKLTEERFAISRLGHNLGEYMPGGTEEEARQYVSELNAAKLESDHLIAVRDLIFEGTSENRALEFIADRNALGEVAALRIWGNKPEIRVLLEPGGAVSRSSSK